MSLNTAVESLGTLGPSIAPVSEVTTQPKRWSRVVGDSIQITLNPFLSHGNIQITGILAADSVVGTWLLNSSVQRKFGTAILAPVR